MRDAEPRHPATGAIPVRPEGEPHLTFQSLLADTLHEMTRDETEAPSVADAAADLRDDALAALRTSGGTPLVRPFHHAYLTPMHSPAIDTPHPPRLDVRS